MAKVFIYAGMLVAVVLVLLFAVDLSPLKRPFYQASPVMDIGFIICGLILGYLSWSTLREQR